MAALRVREAGALSTAARPSIDATTKRPSITPAPEIDWTMFKCSLAGADLIGANLVKAKLSSTNLTGADLTRADLSNADLSATTMTGVIYSNTTCSNGTNSNARTPESCAGQGGGL